MAKVEWSAGIDSVSGALAKPSKEGQHSCDKMLLGTHRTAATTSDKCTRLYLRKQKKRSTPVTNDELARRTRFAAVAQAVTARMQDPVKVMEDQVAFMEQKNGPDGKKTMRSYLWSLETAAYDQAQG